MTSSEELMEILSGHTFDLEGELKEGDMVMNAVLLLHVVNTSEIGQGRSVLLFVPEEGLDPIILSGMVHNAVAAYNEGSGYDDDE